MAPINYYPPSYQEWLFQSLGLNPGEETSPAILESLHELHRRLRTDDMGAADDYSSDEPLLRAYTLYYMTINMPKVWFLFDRCPSLITATTTGGRVRSIGEFGCGPGTFLWATLFYLLAKSPASLKSIHAVCGVDLAPEALVIARRLGQELQRRFPEFRHIDFAFVHDDWKNPRGFDCDWKIFGNTLVESGRDETDWITTIGDASAVLIIEPGTVRSFHGALKVRDRFIREGWQVLFPCTSHHRCPMATDNWCHFQVNRFVLPFIQRLSDRAGRINPRHHFTGFALARTSVAPAPNRWRVLSQLRRVNRSGVRYVCDGERMVELVLNRRDKSEVNRDFLTAAAGDAITLEPAGGKQRFMQSRRIGKADIATRLAE